MKPRYETRDELTPRERDVASLIIHGLENHEIAAALSVSRKAVERHVSDILSKLGLKNRTQLVLHLVATDQVLIW